MAREYDGEIEKEGESDNENESVELAGTEDIAEAEEPDDETEIAAEGTAEPYVAERMRPYSQELFHRLNLAPVRRSQDVWLSATSARHPLLRNATVENLLDRFYAEPIDGTFRDALLVILLDERRAAGSKHVVSDVLLRVVLPALASLARKWKIEDRSLDSNDIESYCIVAFYEALEAPTLQRRRRSVLPHIESLIRDRFDKLARRTKREKEIRRQLGVLLPWARRTAEVAGDGDEILGLFNLISKQTEKSAPLEPDEIAAAYARFDRRVPCGLVSPEDRELIVRVKGCGEKVVRVATTLGLKANTASQRIKRSLATIREHLASQDEDAR